jgi:hypothetical protein
MRPGLLGTLLAAIRRNASRHSARAPRQAPVASNIHEDKSVRQASVEPN